jgi:hypothetical protein
MSLSQTRETLSWQFILRDVNADFNKGDGADRQGVDTYKQAASLFYKINQSRNILHPPVVLNFRDARQSL